MAFEYVPPEERRRVIDRFYTRQRQARAAAEIQALADQRTALAMSGMPGTVTKHNPFLPGGAFNMALFEGEPIEYPGGLIRREDLRLPWFVVVAQWAIWLLALGSAVAWAVL